jgi:hypothetical protein
MLPQIMPVLQHFRGQCEQANYQIAPIPGYRGNPLIEALPTILTVEETARRLKYEPDYDETLRSQPTELRLHLLHDTLRFFKPMPVHFELEQRFSRIVRAGYQGRNPLERGFRQEMAKRLDTRNYLTQRLNQTRSQGFTLLGVSGIGKTTAIEAVLSLYPQVILHNEYGGQPFNHLQVVWLKLDCPHDGSVRGLCLNFFQAMDNLLETRYYAYYARSGRATTDEMLPAMARVSAIHSLGVLVIDEIQHLNEAYSGGASRTLNFFVQLVNTIGMPVVLVGTPKAHAILTGEFRQARRGAGQGDLVWNRMQEDAIWQLFVKTLWMYQFTRHSTPLTLDLSHTLYDETQGITDLAVKVYMLAQFRAMTTGKEELTEAILHSVAVDSLRLAQPVLTALRSGDKLKQGQFEDIQPLDIEPYVHKALAQIQQRLEPHPSPETNTDSQDVVPTPRRSRSRHAAETGLLAVHAQAETAQTTTYAALQASDYLRPALEYLEEQS